MRSFISIAGWLAVLCVVAGCGRKDAAARAPASAAAPAALRKIVLQSDWFPQAEHGGFYQALARGFYREAGLDVEILSGGPGAGIKLKVAKGEAQFGMNRSDDVIVAASHGLPLLIVGAVMQHDHQAILLHDDSPVRTFKDLDGRSIIAAPGQTWIPFLEKKYGIKFALRPMVYGLGNFLAEKDGIQQCLVTNEPYFAQQKGVRVRTMPIADSGYDVYHVIFTRKEFARQEPDVVRAFVAASIRGWRDYIEGDPTPANTLILQRNPNMTAAFLEFSRGELILRHLASGDLSQGEDYGRLSLDRIRREMDILDELKVIETRIAVNSVATRDFLPPEK